MLGLDRETALKTVDAPKQWEAVTRHLHLQNLAMAWQFAGHFTSEELLQLWVMTREALHDWKTPEGGSSR